LSAGGRGARDALLRRSPAQAVFSWRARRRLVVLAYHAVADGPSFARQVDLVVRVATPIRPDQLAAAVAGGAPLPDRPVLFTFDDGDPSVLEVAAPILEQRAIGGLAFVVTDPVGTDRPMWWREVEGLVDAGGQAVGFPASDGRAVVAALKGLPDDLRRAAMEELRDSASGPAPAQRQLTVEDLRRLEQSGIEVGSHSASHPCLPQAADAVVREELERSRDALAGWLGHAPRTSIPEPERSSPTPATTWPSPLTTASVRSLPTIPSRSHASGSLPPRRSIGSSCCSAACTVRSTTGWAATDPRTAV
jgi:peptidoglycan/xylan/chitin deacetylase (PgdA/CDA1 family)